MTRLQEIHTGMEDVSRTSHTTHQPLLLVASLHLDHLDLDRRELHRVRIGCILNLRGGAYLYFAHLEHSLGLCCGAAASQTAEKSWHEARRRWRTPMNLPPRRSRPQEVVTSSRADAELVAVPRRVAAHACDTGRLLVTTHATERDQPCELVGLIRGVETIKIG